MQAPRGTKDIIPEDIIFWQHIYKIANEILSLHNYKEIRTPLLEYTELFQRTIGHYTDIVNKEMYSFTDQGDRNITLRPEGTASIARAFISNKLYLAQKISRLWYFGPMFRYERPQKGRQRQFHQLGIECLGSCKPIADVEVIRLAINILQELQCKEYTLEINSIGNIEERNCYQEKLIEYLIKYKQDLDKDSQQRLNTNPLRILDSKNIKTQEILNKAPKLQQFLNLESLNHFNEICKHLTYLQIPYKINEKLVRGLDYYNYTAFEIKSISSKNNDTICGGGRYDQLIQQLGGPTTPSVGWAIGVERLLIIVKEKILTEKNNNTIYIIIQSKENYHEVWDIIKIIEKYKIKFELDLSNSTLSKQIKKAYQLNIKICFIIGEEEIKNKKITIKWLKNHTQQQIHLFNLTKYLQYIKEYF